MNDCRSIIREFLQSLKERQSEFNDSFYADADVVVEDPEKSASPADGFERFRYAPFDVEGSFEEPETTSDQPPFDSPTGSAAATAKIPPAFVWTKRIVRVRGYGKQSRMCLLPRGSADSREKTLQTPDYTSVAAKRRRTTLPKQVADEEEREKRKSTRAKERYLQKVVDKSARENPAEIRDEIITLIS